MATKNLYRPVIKPRMNIAIASDHAAVDLKAKIIAHIKLNHDVKDLGPATAASVDYPDFASLVAKDIIAGKSDIGILICGTGIGMSIAANRFGGIRAALAHNEFTAQMAREHNDANILCFGARVLPEDGLLAKKMVDMFLKTLFVERHRLRTEKLG